MRTPRAWVLGLALGFGAGVPVGAGEREAHASTGQPGARKPPPKSSGKRKSPPPRKKPRKKQSAVLTAQEEELHTERLAVLGRFKEVNETLRDAELAATIRRLEELEGKRHGLASKVIAATVEQERAAEENP